MLWEKSDGLAIQLFAIISMLQNSNESTLDASVALITVPSASMEMHQLTMMEDRMYAQFLHYTDFWIFFLLHIHMSLFLPNFNFFLLYCCLSGPRTDIELVIQDRYVQQPSIDHL